MKIVTSCQKVFVINLVDIAAIVDTKVHFENHTLGAKCSENGWEITRRKLRQNPPKIVRWVAIG